VRRRSTRKEFESLFIEALALTGDVKKAARASGLPRSTAYDWRAADGAFAGRWRLAIKAAVGGLESDAIRRATTGWLVPVFYKGKIVGYQRKFSDRLLIHLMKVMDPEHHNVGATAKSAPAAEKVDIVRILKDEYANALAKAQAARGRPDQRPAGAADVHNPAPPDSLA
jgi:hypothetical protein